MVFLFRLLTSVVGIYKDTLHQNLTLATGWNLTNTLVMGIFIVVALREPGVQRAKAAAAISAAPLSVELFRPGTSAPAFPTPAPVAAPAFASILSDPRRATS